MVTLMRDGGPEPIEIALVRLYYVELFNSMREN
jgi:hypothetical protein